MPNQRREGTVVTSFALPRALRDAAQAAAAEHGTTVGAVVRAALERYVKRHGKEGS